MNKIIVLSIFISINVYAGVENNIRIFAKVNGYNPSDRIVSAIARAAVRYNILAAELTAIAIVETSLGTNIKSHHNSNGTIDKGLFQINSINQSKCVEYNLNSPEGSAMCAAKLLYEIRKHYKDYLGVYHSKTPSMKNIYLKKVNQILVMK
jgi:hypothetical protein